ncbi:MAG: VWA domain-containing protein [Chloroflexi bacterium]|nr:VWA domain-containing protein [Chloroflexota bacterium]
MLSYRYSSWDGTQDILQLHHEELMEELSDYLLAQGDLQSALRMLMQRGMRDHPLMGLQELQRRLRAKRQQTLDRYNLGSVVEELQKELEEVLRTEREGIQERLTEARERVRQSQENASPSGEREQQQDDQSTGPDEALGGQDGLDPAAAQRLAEFVERLAQQKLQFLEGLPKELGGALTELASYEFMSPEAKRLYDELMEKLRQQVAQSLFQQLSQGLQSMGPEQTQRLQEMLRDLNQLLEQKLKGADTTQDFQRFKEKWAPQMGGNPPESLEELLEGLQQQMGQMQSLMESLSGQQRSQLQDMLASLMEDMSLREELADLEDALSRLFPQERGQRYPFRGEEGVDLQEAMRLMEDLKHLEELEKSLRSAQYGEGIDQIDSEEVRKLLGEEEAQSLETLKELAKALEEAGYIRRDGERLELTPRGMRKIGQKALRDIFERLKQDRMGRHPADRKGVGIERLDELKRYEFGDPFFLDLERTVMNAVERGGPGVPVALRPADFEVYRTEQQTQSSTVLMLDLSWSMARRGSFYAAKKVILALHNLIRTQFPRDSVYIVGFSTYARELKPDQLPYITWDQAEPYTNMQQGLMISQRLLAKHKSGTKQIIMISDGEPTAHIERGQIFLGYPPSPRTITETLREVKRCTREGIVINVFMLDRSYYLKEFVDQLTKINRGRAFYTSPEKLGQYVMVDYLAGKRRRIA